MPNANWLTAAKQTPCSPIVVVEVESGDTTMVRHNLASDWNAATEKTSIEIIANADNLTATVRPARFLYHSDDVVWIREFGGQNGAESYKTQYTTPTVLSYLESISAVWLTKGRGWNGTSISAICTIINVNGDKNIYNANIYSGGSNYVVYTLPGIIFRFFPAGIKSADLTYMPYPANSLNISNNTTGFIWDVTDNGTGMRPNLLWPANDANYLQVMRAKSATFYTAPFDLGSIPASPSIFTSRDATPGAATVTYTAQTSADGTTWTTAGIVIDGAALPASRYYRFFVAMECGCDPVTGALAIPEVSEIKVVGGNGLFEYYSNSTDVTVPGYDCRNLLKSVSGTAAKIDLKGKPTVGDLSCVLHWTKETGSMVVATNRKRAIRAYIGFAGLAWADYAPYFSGLWDSVALNQDKREITVKVFDVWKLFKKKVPEIAISAEKAQLSEYQINGNIIDVITDLTEKIGVPGRFMDTPAFASLKAAAFTSGWTAARIFSQQENSDDLLAELAVTAGIFLLPGADGKLRPVHYDTAMAASPSASLDAGRHQFAVSAADFGETITQVRIFYGALLGGDVAEINSFPKCYVHVNTDAETDRDERIPMEWLDKWHMAESMTSGVANPLTRLADRLLQWYCPTRTVNGKQVATAAIKVSVSELPLTYLESTRPGSIVTVDNLRIPAPSAEWGGFSSAMKFLVIGQKINSQKWSISLDLRQVGEISYTTSPNWYQYASDNSFQPLPNLSAIARENILQAQATDTASRLAAAAAVTAEWTGISGTGKPADNATVGAQVGVNFKDSAGVSLVDSDIKNSAIKPGGGNIASNGGFLTGSPVPTGFAVYNNAAISVTNSIIAGGAVGTSNAWRIVANANTSLTFGFHFNDAVIAFGGWKANTDYIVSFYARGTTASVGFYSNWNNSPAVNTVLQNPNISATTWQRYVWRINFGNNPIDVNGFWSISSPVVAGQYLEFSCVQVEHGEVASGWSNSGAAVATVADWMKPGQTTIDGNKIFTGDAYVDTLQIKGEAVTVTSNAFTMGEILTNVAQTIQSIVISTVGNEPVNIAFTSIVGNKAVSDTTVALWLYRDATLLINSLPTVILPPANSAGSQAPYVYTFRDTPGAGTHTYSIKCNGQSPNYCGVSLRSLTVTGVKR